MKSVIIDGCFFAPCNTRNAQEKDFFRRSTSLFKSWRIDNPSECQRRNQVWQKDRAERQNNTCHLCSWEYYNKSNYVLSNKKEKKMVKEQIYCAKCSTLMQETILPEYEYVVGLPLKDVSAYKCPNCNEIFFTEEQASSMEKRSKALERVRFGFERKITITGKSLAVTIPSDLANHLLLKQGSKVKIVPLSDESILIKKMLP